MSHELHTWMKYGCVWQEQDGEEALQIRLFRLATASQVCCSVLQCVAVCFSVLQCVAVCCSVLQCVAVC